MHLHFRYRFVILNYEDNYHPFFVEFSSTFIDLFEQIESPHAN